MGCCGSRDKDDDYVKTEQRWDYINLDDFKTKHCLQPFAYGWLWLMFIVSISVYAVDTFTAVNLIIFDQWSGQVKPFIPFHIARWIFAGCIILSFIILFYRWWRAIRVMRQGGVAKSYLDPLAARVQCIRTGQGKGYKRFLLFAELTKSRKGADYVALFAYFSFEAAIRIIFAEGPRHVINAITLYAVMQASLIPNETQHDHAPFVQFWFNLGALADQNKQQAVILLGMLWTLFIWVLAALSLLISCILYVVFLWRHTASEDGLVMYCRNKINRRMERIVLKKADKALKKENERRLKEEAKAERKGLKLHTQPTLPDISADGHKPSLKRYDTVTTLPEYESRPGSNRNSNDDLAPMPGPFNGSQRPGPMRHGTQRSDASWSSYNSNAPLMSSAGDMGVQTPMSAEFTPTSGPWAGRPMPQRSATGFSSQYSDRLMSPAPRPPTAQSGHSYQMEPLSRSFTNASSVSQMSGPGPEIEMPPLRGQTPAPNRLPPPTGDSGSYFPYVTEERNEGRNSPAPGLQGRSFTYQDPPTRSFTPAGPPPRSFTPAERSMPPRSFTPQGPPMRALTPGGPPPRSYTPQAPPPSNGPTYAFDQQPTLPRIDTSMSHRPGYMPLDARSATPSSAHTVSRAQNHGPPHTRNLSQRSGPDQRQYGGNRNSGVDDILSHY